MTTTVSRPTMTTTTIPTPTTTSPTTQSTTRCEPEVCSWSEWFDVDFPSSGPSQGDFETYQHIRAAGKEICQHPKEIECRAEDFPEVSIQYVGQVVQCDVHFGLVCKNEDQTGKFKMCLNYKIRVLCCSPNYNCPGSTTLPTSSPTTITSPTSTGTATTPTTVTTSTSTSYTPTTLPTSSETTSQTYTTTTTTLTPTTTIPTPTTTSPTTQSTTRCEPEVCSWSEWFDVDFPSSGPSQGDFETYQHIRAAGKEICQHPKEIECRAEDFPEVSIQYVGQVVQCDVHFGLVCKNEDQTGKFKMCLNYKIRVLCCSPNYNCPGSTTLPTSSPTTITSPTSTGTATTPTTVTTSTSTSYTPTTLPTSSETTSQTYTTTTTTLTPTTTIPTPTTTSPTTQSTTRCEPEVCSWSEWFDVDFPSSGPSQGDFETYQHIRAAGKEICQHPKEIECRAEDFPEVSIQYVGQVVQCDVHFGLVCKNEDQTGKFKMCLNYKIRVLCCSPNYNCPGSTTLPTSSPTTITSPTSTGTATTPTTVTTSTSTSYTPTTLPTSSETTSQTYTTTTTTLTPTTTIPTPTTTSPTTQSTTRCEPEVCSWSEWFDVDFPSSGPSQGDFETYQHIRAAGKEICQHPKEIECRAEDFPEVSIQYVGQVVQCDVHFGLVCKNEDQTGKFKMCLNYKIRVLCCSPNYNCPGSTTLPTSSPTTITSPTSTGTATTPTTVTTSTSTSYTPTTLPTSSETTSQTYTTTTTTLTPTTTIPTPTTTSPTTQSTTRCEPEVCSWSEWFDVDFPSSGPSQGDFETYQHIRAAGKEICQHPKEIECRAEDFPEVSIQYVGQVVQCDVHFGLVCKNEDQTGKFKMCLNYKIRVLCCSPNYNCPGSTTLPTSSPTTITSPTSTGTATTPTTVTTSTSTSYTPTTLPTSSETTSQTYTTTTTTLTPTTTIPTPTTTSPTTQSTTRCEPEVCSWSEWFDVDFPSSGPSQGDFETYQHIRAAGKEICQHPKEIECRAEDFPEVSIQYVGQIRVLCCSPNYNCPGSTTLPTSSPTTITSPTSTGTATTPTTVTTSTSTSYTPTTLPTSSETTSQTYTTTTTTLTPTTTIPTPTTTSPTTQSTTRCEPEVCSWSEWFDVDFPSSGPSQGDFETYQHIRAAGKEICQHPKEIECRAEDFPEVSIQYVGQVVQCDVHFGLVCKNEDQTGKFKMCLNYKIRVLCCSPNYNCPGSTTLPTSSPTTITSPTSTGTATTPTTVTTSTSTSYTPTTLPTSSETTSQTYTTTTTTLTPTTTIPTPTTTSPTTQSTTRCEPEVCSWSEWFDVDFPSSGPSQGDFETYQHIRAAGKEICQHPKEIECRAEDFPEVSIQYVGQVVQCDVHFGLVCKNEDQTGKFKMCLNYKIRVLCCSPNYNCPGSTTLPTSSPTTITSPTSTGTATTPTTVTTSTSTSYTPTTLPTSSETTSQTYTTTTTTLTPTTTIPTPTTTSPTTQSTTRCEPEVCSWSEWFDVDFPSSGPSQGDFETYQHIRAAGKEICQHPKEIECRAEDFPEVSIQYVGQVVQCDVHFGLVCKNEDQTGKFKMCLNYKIRVLCCSPNYNCPGSTTLPTSSPTTITSPTSTGTATTPTTVTTSTSTSYTPTTLPTSSETTSQTYTTTTTTLTPTTTIPTPTTTSPTTQSTTRCEPEVCSWSEWFDVDFPSSGPSQGDFETYQHIRAAGKEICQHPKEIECRAEDFPEVSIQYVGQVVQCDVHFGLVCKNEDQTGKFKMCLNYKIRVLCCSPNYNCPGSTTLPTSSPTTITSPTSTGTATTPTTVTTSTSTSYTPTTLPTSSETTSQTYTTTTTTLTPTTTIPTPTTTSPTTQSTTRCEPEVCSWSEWFDVDFPSSGPSQGDFETYQHIRAAGKEICQHPKEIECRAEDFPEVSIQYVGQVVQCDVHFGLVCKNEDQTGKFKMCLNYKIRVLCCSPNYNCPGSTTLPTSSPTTITSPTSTGTATTPTTVTTSTSTSYTPTTLPTSSETTSQTYTTTTTTLTPTTTIPTPTTTSPTTQSTTRCEPEVCSWSEWFDVDFPSSGPSQGDFETYQHIRAAGKEICQHPKEIECRAEDFPEVSIQYVGQVVQCDVHFGLVCKNEDQTGKFKMCLNYKIRVLCCSPNYNCPGSTTLPTSSPTTITSPTSTGTATTPTTVTTSTSTSYTPTTLPTSSETTSQTYTTTTTTLTPTTTIPTPTTTSPTTQSTTRCEPEVCSWSEWFDVDFPSSGPSQGDFETYQHIRAAGKEICQHPKEIECRAEDFPEVSIQYVGQVVQCDVHFGLVCKNEDQTGKFKMCLNYKIRVLCCSPNYNCPGSTTLPTSSPTTITSPTSTGTATTPTTVTTSTSTSYTPTTLPTSSETTSQTYTTTTTTLTPTTTIPTPTTTSPTTQSTTRCEPEVCSWSEWFDVDFPSSGPSQGDFETYQHIRAAGKEICQHPKEIECRAEDFPEVSIQYVGQVVQCDVHFGLVCKNEDQTGKFKMCLNYKIRVLCCSPNYNCPGSTTLPTSSPTTITSPTSTGTATTPTTVTTSTSTSYTPTTLPTSSETTSQTYTTTTTTLTPTTTIPTPTTTSPTTQSTTRCEPEVCSWSEWFDVDFPSSGPSQGDFETYQHIRAAGKEICQHPKEIECRAEDFPEVSIQYVGQVVQCDVHFGLVCKNEDQTGKFKMCLNYKIRVLCCSPNYNCPGSTTLPTSSPTTITSPTSTGTATTPTTVTTSTSTSYTPTTLPTSSETTSQTYTTTTTTLTPTTTIPTPTTTSPTTQSTTRCEPEVCSWSEWFDVDFPSSGPSQGDFETYQHIRAAGKEICQHPKEIECRAEDFPEVSIQYVGQVVQCDVHFGLVCKNEDQTGKFKMCLNYKIRVLCCSPNYNCPGSTTLPTSSPTTITSPTSTGTATTPTTVTTSTSTSYTPTTLPTSSETTSQTYTTTTTTLTPTTTIPTPTTTSPTTQSTTRCEPEVCSWSEWFDVDFPSSGPSQGDFETYQHIRAAGKEICQHPKEIECRAEDFPEVSIQYVGQVVQCDVHFGLVCKNEDQTGKFKMCLNYKIRVLCCSPNYNCPGSTTLPTSSPTTITSPTSTGTATTPTTVTTSTSTSYTPTTLPTSSETTSQTYTTTTTTLTPTTTIPTPTTTSPTTQSTTRCEPEVCSWSEWFDVDFPSSGPSQGDFETYQHIRAAGKEICQHPKEIECRAEDFPEVSIQYVGQVVQCDVHFGLVCKNEDQTGKFKMCLNYKIRVLCCSPNYNCPGSTTLPTSSPTTITSPTSTGTATTPTTVTTSTSTSYTPTTLPTSSETTSQTYTTTTTTTLTPTTTIPTPTTTSPTTQSTTRCEPEVCSWSEWFDVDFPSSGPSQGDFETYQHIRAAGKEICQHPKEIECRAEDFPEVSIQYVGQVVQCDVHFGLVCKNEDQTGKFKMCLNYKIRVLCCSPNYNCPGSTTLPTSSPTTITSPTSTGTATTPTTVTTSTSTSYTPTTLPTSSETTSQTYTTTTTTLTPTTTIPTPTTTSPTTQSTTRCEPEVCSWSEWFDVDFPSSGPSQGDFETYQHIRAAGKEICQHPKEIECRAEDFPEVSIQYVGQVVQCDVHFGLVCKNEDQTGKFKMCLNYKIRVLCCSPNYNCPGSTTLPTSSPTTITSPTSTGTATTPTTVTTSTSTSYTPTTLPTSSETTSQTYTTTTTTTLTPTTTIPTPTTTSPTTQSTTRCEPEVCSWSEWFDVDFPSSGPSQGDFETYQHIRAAGKEICQHPKEIECRAEDFPEVSIQYVGQVVQCDVHFGLVCKNEDQTGKFKMCLNYKIRVLCCSPNYNCPGSTTLPTSSPTTITSPTSTGTATTPTTVTTSTSTSYTPTTLPTSSETTSQTYTTTTTTTLTPTTTIPTPTTTSPTTQSTTRCEPEVCSWSEWFDVDFPSSGPSQGDFETYQHIRAAGKEICQHPKDIECQADYPDISIQDFGQVVQCDVHFGLVCKNEDQTGKFKMCLNYKIRVLCCSPNYNCPGSTTLPTTSLTTTTTTSVPCCTTTSSTPVSTPCFCKIGDSIFSPGVCSGWGDPHYITFDGTYYTFLENCTYVLVKQIVPKYDNFRVYIDNYYCDAKDGLSCPKSIIIFYKSAEVVLTRKLMNGVMTNVMYFNKKIVKPGFKKDGISFSTLGINMIVEIQEIGATITFSGLIFSVKLPYSKFGNNTEGQCGTCTNNKLDECRLPSGKIISSCPQMAHHWIVGSNESCHGVPIPPVVTTPSPKPHCETPRLCKLIWSEIFAECHAVIPPEPFFKGCVFDGCRIANESMQCSSLEIYATECAARGVCIDWRGKTNNTCPYNCPATTIYSPCGPINPPTCDPSLVELPGYGVTEGCFCPEGKTLMSEDSNICVSECSCREPNGATRRPGAVIPSGPCEECTCSESSYSRLHHATIKCEPVICDTYCPVVGEFWSAPGDNCTIHTCEKYDDQFIQVVLQKSCPPFNPNDCDPVSILLMFEKVAVANTSDRRIMVSKENT
ncbi:hypothetical protein GRJ2_001470500 [Grus japonensis]|uniref:VWFD domain-containing protein n=1 Tax=Grus japonensis TaxID=30415 RepID=A0ABC9WY43_GRUJA